MIVVQLNKEDFEYDIHSLVKAFYSSENVSVSAENKVKPSEEEDANAFGKKASNKKVQEEPIFATMKVFDYETSYELCFCKNDASENSEADTITERVDLSALAGITDDEAHRKEKKNLLKQGLYRLLSKASGKTLPWGTLTGIRPTKIPMLLLEQGQDEAAIQQYMRDTYYASEEKIDLSIAIAKREKEILAPLDYENGYSLYVGIPFCPSTCLYCSFTSYPLSMWKDRVDSYLDALEKEIDDAAWTYKDKKLNTIYIGGGTPTTLNPAQLDRLLTKLENSFDYSHLLEFTVEAGRPDSITREKLQVLRDHKISRISVNPQTMQQKTLDFIGRHHTVEQTKESFLLARELGFDNINMDLIVGLPGETTADVMDTMEQVKVLKPDNLTVHSLAIKRAARLNLFKDDYKDYLKADTWEQLAVTEAGAKALGMTPYYLYRQKNMAGNFENVGYATANNAGIYNILIMEEKQTILALGAGATTKYVFENGTRMERVANVKDVKEYIERIDEMIKRKHDTMMRFGLR